MAKLSSCILIFHFFPLAQLCVQLNHSLPSSSRSVEVEAASEAHPLPRSGPVGDLGHISSDSSVRHMNKEGSKELMEINKRNRQETTTLFPLINPLSLQPSERDDSLHVHFCRELGSDLVEKLGTVKM